MRSRNIKPGFWANEDIGDLPHWSRLLFIGLWCMAEKNGVLEDRPKRIKGELFRYDDLSAEQIHIALNDLQEMDFIQRYSVNGKNLIHIRNFSKHQSPHHTERPSTLPLPMHEEAPLTVNSPLDNGYGTVGPPLQHGGNPPDSLIPDSLIPDSINNTSSFPAQKAAENDGGGGDVSPKSGNGDATNDANHANDTNSRLKKPSLGKKAPIEQWLKALGNGLRTWFEEDWWPAQLRKVGKKECIMAIYDLNPDGALRARMSAALSKQVRDDYQHRDLDKVPHPATWVNGSRWEDEGKGGRKSRWFDD
jgi:hypothetical protein